jgi:hypothetical protein
MLFLQTYYSFLSYLYLVDYQTSVGTYIAAVGAADAVVFIFHVDIMIAAVVHLTRLQFEDVGGTSHHTQITTFATVCVYLYITFKFCHYQEWFLIDANIT